jgi:hypothetical protein
LLGKPDCIGTEVERNLAQPHLVHSNTRGQIGRHLASKGEALFRCLDPHRFGDEIDEPFERNVREIELHSSSLDLAISLDRDAWLSRACAGFAGECKDI